MSQTKRIPYIFFNQTYEGPARDGIIIKIYYEGKEITRQFPPETPIEYIVEEASEKFGYEFYLKTHTHNFNAFIGMRKLKMDRELGFYRNFLKGNGYRIRVQRKININEFKHEVIRDYTHEDIEVLMKFLSDMETTIEQAEQSEEASYQDYQKAKNDE